MFGSMRRHWLSLAVLIATPGVLFSAPATWVLVGWNDLGMHCMDSDYSVFSILPPYNTIHAHLIDASGRLVRDAGAVAVTYEAVADPSGSINTSSANKTNFWQFVQALFGASPAPDTGLAGSSMPGASNQARPMAFDAAANWFTAVGIPLTPYDDTGAKNTYPMMRLVAWDAAGNVLATTSIVLPVSDEMDCRACHSSGSSPAAQPAAGWTNATDPIRDYRLNILRVHDDLEGSTATFQGALAQAGYNSAGLYVTATADQKPVLCAACHASNALAGTGIGGIFPLTQAIHGMHARVLDPATGQKLDDATNRDACYRCHPGSTTQCLRGAMGTAVAPDGSMLMQCQSCHGSMSAVGAATRQGWFQEPACQNCHTGTATDNAGQIRYTSVFDASGAPRQTPDPTFATNADTPAAGLSLYRFSQGHGGLQCEACHGATHAEYPSSHPNDNLQSIAVQGHSGVLAECSACHGASVPSTTNGGPHGLHPIGQSWVSAHQRAARGSRAQCQTCHGLDYRGTVLSAVKEDRTLNASERGMKTFTRGVQIGCYSCHNGPNGD